MASPVTNTKRKSPAMVKNSPQVVGAIAGKNKNYLEDRSTGTFDKSLPPRRFALACTDHKTPANRTRSTGNKEKETNISSAAQQNEARQHGTCYRFAQKLDQHDGPGTPASASSSRCRPCRA